MYSISDVTPVTTLSTEVEENNSSIDSKMNETGEGHVNNKIPQYNIMI